MGILCSIGYFLRRRLSICRLNFLIIFSDSGHFLDKYRNIHDFSNKGIFNKTRAKVVLITSNPEMKNDPRVSYCVSYKKTRSMNTHRIVYGVLTDIIAYKFREAMKKSGKL